MTGMRSTPDSSLGRYTVRFTAWLLPSACLNKTGEWNTEEVIAKGSKITVLVNGKKIVDADIADFRNGKKMTLDAKPHLGLSRTVGHVGFAGHGDEVHFRNIRIKSLE